MLPCIITGSSFSGSETVYAYKINLIFDLVECPSVSLPIIIVKTSLKRHVISVSTQLSIREINNIRVLIYPCHNNINMVTCWKMSFVRVNVSLDWSTILNRKKHWILLDCGNLAFMLLLSFFHDFFLKLSQFLILTFDLFICWLVCFFCSGV